MTTYTNLKSILHSHYYQTILVDSAGVLQNNSSRLIKGCKEAINSIQSQNLNLAMLTNNSFLSINKIVDWYSTMGLFFHPNTIISSGLGILHDPVCISMIKNKRVYVVGGKFSMDYFTDLPSISLVDDLNDSDIVVFMSSHFNHTNITWNSLENHLKACPKSVICCNPDRYVVTHGKKHSVIGSFAEIIQHNSNCSVYWFGKPHQNYYSMAQSLLNNFFELNCFEKVIFFDDNPFNLLSFKSFFNSSVCLVQNTGIAKYVDIDLTSSEIDFVIPSFSL